MAERTFRTAPLITPAGRWGARRRLEVGDTALMLMARCRRLSSVRAAPPPGPTSRPERRLVGAPSPTDEQAAPISEASPAGPPVAPRINAVAITPLEGPKWSAARAPVQRPAEEVRMRSITTLLTTLLGKTGLLEGDFDYHLLRASMVIIFLFFGYQKWWDYEAQTLIPFISNGPLISWMYPVFGIRGASWFLGVSEWLFGALIFIGFWNKTLGALGAAGSCLSFIMTITIIPFMPDGWAASAGGFPAMTGNVPVLLQDEVLLSVTVYLLKKDAARALVSTSVASVGWHNC